MARSQTPIAILIVHGAYFLPSAWEDFCRRLTQEGFIVRCPRLPSCGDARPPTALLEQDVMSVRTAAQELRNAGHVIIVLAHSYGGIVTSEAINQDLYARDSGRGVAYLIYMSAWLVQPGRSLADVITKYGFQCKVDIAINDDGTLAVKNAPESFYNDIDFAKAEELASSNVTHNWLAASGQVNGTPWKDLPITYIYCTRDLAIMLPLQESMVRDALNAGGTSRIFTETIDSSHCPFLSKPEEVIPIVHRVGAEIS
jgi:pimeloyl-ACP methyl ester carboxylesterase